MDEKILLTSKHYNEIRDRVRTGWRKAGFIEIKEHALENQIRRIKRDTSQVPIKRKKIPKFINSVVQTYIRALVDQAENVGIQSANAIGSGVIQATLDTFKKAGTRQNQGATLEAQKEILNVAKRKYPSCILHFKERINFYDAMRSREFFERVRVRDLIQSSDVSLFEDVPTFWYEEDAYLSNRSIPKGRYLLRLKLDGYKMWVHRISMVKLISVINEARTGELMHIDMWAYAADPYVLDIYYNEHMGQSEVRGLQVNINQIQLSTIILPKLKDIRIKGISDITRVFPVTARFIDGSEKEELCGNWICTFINVEEKTKNEIARQLEDLEISIERRTSSRLYLRSYISTIELAKEANFSLYTFLISPRCSIVSNVNIWRIYINDINHFNSGITLDDFEKLFCDHVFGPNRMQKTEFPDEIIISTSGTPFPGLQHVKDVRYNMLADNVLEKIGRRYRLRWRESWVPPNAQKESDSRIVVPELFTILSQMGTEYLISWYAGGRPSDFKEAVPGWYIDDIRSEEYKDGAYGNLFIVSTSNILHPSISAIKYKVVAREGKYQQVEWIPSPLALIRQLSEGKEWAQYVYVQTSGGVLRDLLKINIIDFTKSYSNNLREFFNFFGIEAVRIYVIQEFYSILLKSSSKGEQLDPRAMITLFDYMTSLGGLQPSTHIGMLKSGADVIKKASTTQPYKVFAAGALANQRDEATSMAMAAFTGTAAKIGAACVKLILPTMSKARGVEFEEDEEALEESETTILTHKIEPDIESVDYSNVVVNIAEREFGSQSTKFVKRLTFPSVPLSLFSVNTIFVPPFIVDGVRVTSIKLTYDPSQRIDYEPSTFEIDISPDAILLVQPGEGLTLASITFMEIPNILRGVIQMRGEMTHLLAQPSYSYKRMHIFALPRRPMLTEETYVERFKELNQPATNFNRIVNVLKSLPKLS